MEDSLYAFFLWRGREGRRWGGGWGEVNKVHYVLGENGYISEIQNAIQRKTERKRFLKKEKSIKYHCLNSLIKCFNTTVSDSFSMY